MSLSGTHFKTVDEYKIPEGHLNLEKLSIPTEESKSLDDSPIHHKSVVNRELPKSLYQTLTPLAASHANLHLRHFKKEPITTINKLVLLNRYLTPAMIHVIGNFFEGNGHLRNHLSYAIQFYFKLAKTGSEQAIERLNYFVETLKIGRFAEHRLLLAKTLNYLGVCFENGYAVKKNSATAVTYYHHAAELNNTNAMFHLGKHYQTINDIENAKQWLENAAKYGNKKAVEELQKQKKNPKPRKSYKTTIMALLKTRQNMGFAPPTPTSPEISSPTQPLLRSSRKEKMCVIL